ncbi:hypothetical protein Q767_12345 [Flavobacterium enshiense DK69]|uniref:Uncharacterized protein n=1 Tax=Flavobacterium enshiense DK69 TaxID=1107311 RepID=A0A0A2MUH2_9FLAO|nr:hypothetical protein Q767_12345 [Flavobacterium enshiense DK69]
MQGLPKGVVGTALAFFIEVAISSNFSSGFGCKCMKEIETANEFCFFSFSIKNKLNEDKMLKRWLLCN